MRFELWSVPPGEAAIVSRGARQEGGLLKQRAPQEIPNPTKSARLPGPVQLAVLTLALALVGTIIRSAWVCDDSFITFRTIDNLVRGHGLTWNVAERVQTFTHPLWMLLLAAVYLVTHEAYYTVMAVSILISGVTAWWLVTRVAASPLGALLAVVVLTLSKAYVDYSTSGLENPLTFLLLVLFVSCCMSGRPQSGQVRADPEQPRPNLQDLAQQPRPLALALIAGLTATNRMDALLLVLPVLIAALRSLSWRGRLATCILGFSPFLAWEAFAIVYYGFPFPNSAYAKLATGIPRIDLIRQGLHYFGNSLWIDPVTLVAVGAGALFVARRRVLEEMLLMTGVGLYVAYVLWIGGDFMSGRFLAAPLVVAAAILARWRPEAPGVFALLPCLAVALVGLTTPNSPVYSGADYSAKHREDSTDAARITDERAFYYQETGLLLAGRDVIMPYPSVAREAMQARDRGAKVVARFGVGFFGYFVGPSVFIVEPWAITDPLLARLPVPAGAPWRIGHFRRDIPAGYEETLRDGVNRIADPRVARLYDAIVVVTRGPLFTGRRLQEIWKLNTGAYQIGPS